MHSLHSLPDPEIHRAVQDALEWGYPRDIPPLEVDVSHWYRYGPDVVIWLCIAGPGALGLHMCVSGASRGRLRREDVEYLFGPMPGRDRGSETPSGARQEPHQQGNLRKGALAAICERLGASEMCVIVPRGTPGADKLNSYCNRLGMRYNGTGVTNCDRWSVQLGGG